MNMRLVAIIRKDLRILTKNKQMMISLIVLPLIFVVFMPTLFIMIIHFVPKDSKSVTDLIKLFPTISIDGQFEINLIRMLLNSIIPLFFVMIPIMTSTIMAASSFIGEKEKKTLETLLYSPLTLKEIFQAKVMASFFLSMVVSLISFIIFVIVTHIEVLILLQTLLGVSLNWILTLVLIAPAISIIGIVIIVRGSAKSQTVEEAQQKAVFLVFPIIALVLGQFLGVIMISTWLLFIIGILLSVLSLFLLYRGLGNWSYEKLLD